jgi:hypothetical protein
MTVVARPDQRAVFSMRATAGALRFGQLQPDFTNYRNTYVLAKEGKCCLTYFAAGKPVKINLAGAINKKTQSCN